MADGSKIEWTDATWNPVVGCSVVSPGCANCYAMRLAGTRLRHHHSRTGLTVDSKAGPVWNGEVRLVEEWLDQPLRWKKPRRIFVCAHGDLFHESVPDAWIDRVFAVMALAPQHTFQVLTKRPARMRKWFEMARARSSGVRELVYSAVRDIPGYDPDHARYMRMAHQASAGWPLPNVWAGISAEDQTRANERIPDLLATPAAVWFVSAEPLLGKIILPFDFLDLADRAWVIVGGESGPGARPMHPDWARSLRDQCEAAGVAFHFKQWGNWSAFYDRDRDDPDWRRCGTVERETASGRWLNLAGGHGFHGDRVLRVVPVAKATAGRSLDGRTWDEMPGCP